MVEGNIDGIVITIGKFEFLTRFISFVAVMSMLVVDKGMGIMANPPSDWYYGTLMTYSVFGVAFLDKLGSFANNIKGIK